MRSMASAFKTLRLYPAASPIPRQSAAASAALLGEFLADRAGATILVDGDGLTWDGQRLGTASSTIADLAGRLRDLGVADVTFAGGCSAEDVYAFVGALSAEPETTRAAGGLAAVLARAGVGSILVSELAFVLRKEAGEGRATSHVEGMSAAEADADGLMRTLASDPERLRAWLSGVTANRTTLDQGLVSLAEATGSATAPAAALASVMPTLPIDQRDALLALAFEPGCSREVTDAFVAMLPDTTLGDALVAGHFGANMLSLSSALTRLPLGQRLGAVMERVQQRLVEMGRSAKELRLLEHMVEVRGSDAVEAPLCESAPDIDAIARSVREDLGDLTAPREEVARARETQSARALTTMLTLLDQRDDRNLYLDTMGRIIAMVPIMVAEGDVPLAGRALAELHARSTRALSAWPALAQRLDTEVAAIFDAATCRALLAWVAGGDRGRVGVARAFLRSGGEPALRAVTDAALTSGDSAVFEAAEAVVGRRVLDELCRVASTVPPGNIAAVARRLAEASAEPRCAAALNGLAQRPDSASRCEVAAAVGRIENTTALTLAEKLLDDRDAEVARVAASGLGHNPDDAASRALARRLAQLDVDGRDFPLARDIVLALARHRDPVAVAALDKLAARRSLIKRGNFVAVQEIVRQAAAMQRGVTS